MSDQTRCFVGVKPCGCRVAIVVDVDPSALTPSARGASSRFVRREVNEWLKLGYGIETTTVDAHRKNPIARCVH